MIPCKPRWFSLLLIFAWLLVQAVLLLKQGIHTELEATKYIDQANNVLLNGGYSAPKYFFYSTLIFIIVFFIKIGGGFAAVVGFQIALNGVATYCLFKLGKAVAQNSVSAYITTLLFIVFIPLQSWNTYLYTESLFISLSIFFIYFVHRYPPFTIRNFAIGLFFLILLVLTRPFGVLYMLPFLIYALVISQKTFRIILSVATIAGIAVFFALINYAFQGGEDMDAMKPFKESHIICFMPTANASPLNVRETGKPVSDMFHYIIHTPGHFTGLMVKRLVSFFILPKPYFSLRHNMLLTGIIIPTYLFALIAVWKRRIQNRLTLFLGLIVLIYAVGTTFQCNDYHNRFIMPVFSIILLFTGAGIAYCLSLLKKK